MRVIDLARDEVGGIEGINGQLAIGERSRAVLEPGLKEARALVEATHLVQIALDMGVIPIPNNWGLVRSDGNERVGDGVVLG